MPAKMRTSWKQRLWGKHVAGRNAKKPPHNALMRGKMIERVGEGEKACTATSEGGENSSHNEGRGITRVAAACQNHGSAGCNGGKWQATARHAQPRLKGHSQHDMLKPAPSGTRECRVRSVRR